MPDLCSPLFPDRHGRGRLGNTDQDVCSVWARGAGRADKVRRSSQPQYRGPYPAMPSHLQDGAVRPCQTDTIQPARRVRAQTILWVPSFAVPGEHCVACQVMNSKVGEHCVACQIQQVMNSKVDDGMPYPTVWATRLASTHSLTHSLVKPSPLSIKGDALSLKRGRFQRTTDRSLRFSLLGSRTLKPNKAYVRTLSARRSSHHSWPFGPESDRTSDTPHLTPYCL